jgi:hypothetical protein
MRGSGRWTRGEDVESVPSRCSMLGRLGEHRRMRLLGNVQRQPGMLAWLEAEIGVWWRDGSGRGTHFTDGTCQGRLRAHTRERES